MSNKNDITGWGIDGHLDYIKIYIMHLLEWPEPDNTECIWYIPSNKSLKTYGRREEGRKGGWEGEGEEGAEDTLQPAPKDSGV